MSGISEAESVATIVKLCVKITGFITDVIREVKSEEHVTKLRADIHSLSEEVELVDELCKKAKLPSSTFVIPQRMLVRIETKKGACQKTLKELESLLMQVSGGFATGRLARYAQAISVLLRSDKIEKLRQDVTKHQQSFHYYVTLITE